MVVQHLKLHLDTPCVQANRALACSAYRIRRKRMVCVPARWQLWPGRASTAARLCGPKARDLRFTAFPGNLHRTAAGAHC